MLSIASASSRTPRSILDQTFPSQSTAPAAPATAPAGVNLNPVDPAATNPAAPPATTPPAGTKRP
jgi:hypothetical protein